MLKFYIPETGSPVRFLFRKLRPAGRGRVENPAERLLAAFDALGEERRDEAARQLSRLWAWFREEFGGPSEFLARPAADQDRYLGKLAEAVERSAHLKDTEFGRFYFSAALLRDYLLALRADDTSASALEISYRVVWLVERGRELGARG